MRKRVRNAELLGFHGYWRRFGFWMAHSGQRSECDSRYLYEQEGLEMREIKFRAWDWIEKQMCPVIVADFQDVKAKVFCRLPKSGTQGIFSADLMQYIGAKDKNGVEIYEGDIIRHQSGKYGTDFEIKWSPILCGFTAMQIESGHPSPQLNQGTMCYFEVVGNIYENPELVSNEANT